MDDDFKLRAALKSVEELHDRVNNREKYLPETVEAAVTELQHRGEEFSEEELKVIAEDMQAGREISKSGNYSFGMYNRYDKNVQVEDPEAPSFYSKRVIFVFSVIFSALFGGILLAINISKTENRNKAILAVLFGLGYTIAAALIAQNFNLNSSFSVVFIFLGAYLLESLFWNRYIGNSTLYKPRQIWIPLVIGIVIMVPVVIAIFYYGTNK
jgi:hypothetical protein